MSLSAERAVVRGDAERLECGKSSRSGAVVPPTTRSRSSGVAFHANSHRVLTSDACGRSTDRSASTASVLDARTSRQRRRKWTRRASATDGIWIAGTASTTSRLRASTCASQAQRKEEKTRRQTQGMRRPQWRIKRCPRGRPAHLGDVVVEMDAAGAPRGLRSESPATGRDAEAFRCHATAEKHFHHPVP